MFVSLDPIHPQHSTHNESRLSVGYQILTSRYTGLEQSFPSLFGKCDASHHVETTARFGARTQSFPKGIPAEPHMGREIRIEALAVARHFAVLDGVAKGHFRAARDILFRDYVELVIARVLGPERVLWFLRECLVYGGTEYFQARSKHSIIAKTKEEQRREAHDNVRMWDKLWAGWTPQMPLAPDAVQLRGPEKDTKSDLDSPSERSAEQQDSKKENMKRGSRSSVPVTDTESVDQDVMTMASEAALQELHPEPPSTTRYGKQTWDLPDKKEEL